MSGIDQMTDTCAKRTEDQQLCLQPQEELTILRQQYHELLISNDRKDSEIRGLMERQAPKCTEDQQLCLQPQEQLAILQQLYNELLISNDRKDSEIRGLMERQALTERQLEHLQKTSSIQYQELQTCKDNLFGLQPAVQKTDSDILKQYETLCQHISSWVDNEMSRIDDEMECLGNNTRSIIDGRNTQFRRILNSAPEAGEYLVSMVIHENIQRAFFRKNELLFGLPSGVTGFLRSTEERMARLEPSRNTTTINAWRSETLIAVANIPGLIQYKDSMVEGFTDRLFSTLKNKFPGLIDEPKSKSRLHHDVSRYAAQLEASIHQSSTNYHFQRTRKPECYHGPIKNTDLTGRTFIDVETRKTLKPDSPMIPDRDGYIGRPLILIEPGLDRCDVGGKKTRLRQPNYLIKLHTPLSRRTG